MHRTNIYLDDRQREALDRADAEEDTPRAELIRRVLDRWLAGGGDDVAGDLEALESSFGALADMDVSPRAPDARASHLDWVWRLPR